MVAGTFVLAAQGTHAQTVRSGPAEFQGASDIPLAGLLEEAGDLEHLKSVMVAVDGVTVAARAYRGNDIDAPTNIKSASKSVISALVGMAIERGLLRGTDQKIADILTTELPEDPDPRLRQVTIGHLLSMQAGLERTSGANYGSWIASRNWVRNALARRFVDEPGGAMLYSTGSTHLLSAILTKVSARSTLDLARDWFAPLEQFHIASWQRDRQGIPLGGNQMAMTTRSLLAFGELYRAGGRAPDGTRLLSQDWIAASWQPRTTSRWTGDGYGYGWFIREMGGQTVYFGWGYGGQMIYVVPGLALTVAITSDENPSARNGYRDALHALMAGIVRAVGG